MNWKTFAFILERAWILSPFVRVRFGRLMNKKFSILQPLQLLYPLITPFLFHPSIIFPLSSFPNGFMLLRFKMSSNPFLRDTENEKSSSSRFTQETDGVRWVILIFLNLCRKTHGNMEHLRSLSCLAMKAIKAAAKTAASTLFHNLNWLFVYSPKRLK